MQNYQIWQNRVHHEKLYCLKIHTVHFKLTSLNSGKSESVIRVVGNTADKRSQIPHSDWMIKFHFHLTVFHVISQSRPSFCLNI